VLPGQPEVRGEGACVTRRVGLPEMERIVDERAGEDKSRHLWH